FGRGYPCQRRARLGFSRTSGGRERVARGRRASAWSFGCVAFLVASSRGAILGVGLVGTLTLGVSPCPRALECSSLSIGRVRLPTAPGLRLTLCRALGVGSLCRRRYGPRPRRSGSCRCGGRRCCWRSGAVCRRDG